MRTLHLLASTDRRGAEVFGTELAATLDARGHENEVVALSPGATGGLEVEVLEALANPGAARELRRRARGVDVVLGHGSRGLVAATLATAGTHTPFVYRSIGDPGFWGSSPLRRWRVGLQLRRAARVTALWPDAADAIARQHRVPRSRLAVVPNSADPRRFAPATPAERTEARRHLGIPEQSRVVAYVGALSREKRVELVVDAVASLSDVHLVVAGGGGELEAVQTLGDRLLGPRLHCVGQLDDVAPVYRAADAIALLSRTEGQPGTLIEAGLSGLPAVATRVGGTRSVVVAGRTGMLVEPDVDPATAGAALAEAIDRREPLGAAAREHCREKFDAEVVTSMVEAVLVDAVASRR